MKKFAVEDILWIILSISGSLYFITNDKLQFVFMILGIITMVLMYVNYKRGGEIGPTGRLATIILDLSLLFDAIYYIYPYIS